MTIRKHNRDSARGEGNPKVRKMRYDDGHNGRQDAERARNRETERRREARLHQQAGREDAREIRASLSY